MKKNIKLMVIVAVVIVASVFTFNKVTTNDNKADDANSQVAVAPSGITYPSGWQEASKILATNKEAGAISEADHLNPTVKVIVSILEKDLGSDFKIKDLPSAIEDSLSRGIQGFSLVSKEITKFGSRDAVKIEYKDQDSSDNNYNNVMFIVPTQKKTFYIAYRSNEDLGLVKSDMSSINDSVASYIKTHL